MTRPTTSLDWFKTAALLLMVVDHIGYFFFPENMWLRAVGRASAPLWFLLAGYVAVKLPANKPLPYSWLAYGALVDIASFILLPSHMFMPFCVLFTLFAARFAAPILIKLHHKQTIFYGLFLFCLLVGVPSDAIVEYGTFGIAFAILGAGIGVLPRQNWVVCLGVCVFAYMCAMGLTFPFDAAQVVLAAGLTMLSLWAFSYAVTRPVPQVNQYLQPILYLCGRYSLQLYVGHWVVFATVYALFH